MTEVGQTFDTKRLSSTTVRGLLGRLGGFERSGGQINDAGTLIMLSEMLAEKGRWNEETVKFLIDEFKKDSETGSSRRSPSGIPGYCQELIDKIDKEKGVG